MKRKVLLCITAAAAVCAAFLIVLFTVIIPSVKYSSAMELYNAGKYREACTAFQQDDGSKAEEEIEWIVLDIEENG